MTDEPLVQPVKLRIRLRPHGDRPAGEFLWATPLDAHDGGGRYELSNCATLAWLAAGDLVRAEVDGEGNLQVVELLEPCDGILSVISVAPEAGELARQAGDAWLRHGARWSEGGYGVLTTIWSPGVELATIQQLMAPYLEGGAFAWVGAATPEQRRRDHQQDLDLELDRTPPPEVSTTYWAADDPFWLERGLTDPEFLAHVQTLASIDESLARSLEQGDHEPMLQLLRWLEES